MDLNIIFSHCASSTSWKSATPSFPGLNLTFEAREGILKHCSPVNARALGELGKRFINKKQPGLEAQLTNLADEIAYNSHDVDDGLRSGLIDFEQLSEIKLFQQQYVEVRKRYPDLQQRRTVHEIIRRLINCQVVDLINTSKSQLLKAAPESLEDVRNNHQALILFSDDMRQLNLDLKRFLQPASLQTLPSASHGRKSQACNPGIIQSIF